MGIKALGLESWLRSVVSHCYEGSNANGVDPHAASRTCRHVWAKLMSGGNTPIPLFPQVLLQKGLPMSEQLHLPGFGHLQPLINYERLNGAMVAFRRIRVKRGIVLSFLLNLDGHWQKKVVITKGGKRVVTYKPSKELKKLQWKIVRYINNVNRGLNRTILPVPNPAGEWSLNDIASTRFTTAFKRGDSVVKNALAHLDMRSSVSFDLRRAFESIKRKHLQRFLLRLRFPNDVAWVFSKFLTHKGRLQRGASVSAHIFNLLLSRLDMQIAEAVGAKEPVYVGREWANKEEEKGFGWLSPEFIKEIRNKKVSFTRYGDDICVSSALEEFPQELVALIRGIILGQGFQIREAKTRMCRNGVLELPGVVIVGNVVRPRRAYLIRLARSITTSSLTQEQLHGHLAFICSFPRRNQKGAYSLLRKMLGSNVTLPVLRKPKEVLF